jgi:hypothetical protein
MPRPKKPEPTFEVYFDGPNLVPEEIPVRAVTDALSAIQDLASGRDPFELAHVPPEKTIGLLDVRRGSARFQCVARNPAEAVRNLKRVGKWITSPDSESGEELEIALNPIDQLSAIARKLGCAVIVRAPDKTAAAWLWVKEGSYDELSSRVLLKGDTTIYGRIERVGGATEMRCLLRVPDRRKLLYCDVESRELVRRLGQHLYENIAATGTAVWIHRTWRVVRFTLRDFHQPRLRDYAAALQDLREAGLSAWDTIDDPKSYLQEFGL